MAAVLSQKSTFAASGRLSTRRSGVVARPAARTAVVVRASSEKASRAAVLQAAVVSGAAAAMAHPLVAEASVTPSLKNFLGSLVAGAVVLIAIVGAVTLVSGFDPVNRG